MTLLSAAAKRSISSSVRCSVAQTSRTFFRRLARRPGDNISEHLTLYKLAMQESAGVRRTGSAALDLAFVAAGMSDGYFEKGLASWDMAAGALLVQEAGGLIGNFTGEFEKDFLDQRECLAANPRIYAQMVQALAEFSKYKAV